MLIPSALGDQSGELCSCQGPRGERVLKVVQGLLLASRTRGTRRPVVVLETFYVTRAFCCTYVLLRNAKFFESREHGVIFCCMNLVTQNLPDSLQVERRREFERAIKNGDIFFSFALCPKRRCDGGW